MTLHLTPADWLDLLTHFLSLSLLAIGGAITTAPAMHSYLVSDKQWLSEHQFSSSIALAQAAPGPNVLFVALLGWNVGINAAGGFPLAVNPWSCGLFGMLLAMVGILLPSTTFTFLAARWAHQNRELRAVRAFKQGMAPIVVALLIATGWILATGHGSFQEGWRAWLLSAIVTLLVWRTRLHILWLLGAGAVLGALGWI
jgi:chromate transporter